MSEVSSRRGPVRWTCSFVVLVCLGSAPSLATGSNCYLVPDTLTAWWPFHGAAAETRSNSVTYLFGNPAYAPAKVGHGLLLDGIDDHVRIAASPATDVGSDLVQSFAVELWMNPAHTDTQPVLEWNTGTGPSGVQLAIRNGGTLSADLIDATGNRVVRLSSRAGLVQAGQFSHVGLVVADDARGLYAALWHNGEMIAYAVPSRARTPTGYDLYLGYSPAGPLAGARFAGILDEVTLYHGLQGVVMGELYAAGSAGKCTACAAPVFTLAPPASHLVNRGGAAFFPIEARGTRPFSYRTTREDKPGDPPVGLPSATPGMWGYSNLQTNHSGTYRIELDTPCGSVTTRVQLAVVPGPVILRQPFSPAVLAGASAQFSVLATGAPLTYQWWRGEMPLPGETNEVLVIEDVEPSDAADFFVVVSNPYYTVTSVVARLNVGLNKIPADAVFLQMAVRAGGLYEITNSGTILLTNTLVVSNSLVLDSVQHAVSIDGGDAVGLFQVLPNVPLGLQGVTLINGRNTNGGAVCNLGGEVYLREVELINNVSTNGNGGAVCNTGGHMTIGYCKFRSNRSIGRNHEKRVLPGCCVIDVAPTPAFGGAIFNGGTMVISESSFQGNMAQGGDSIPSDHGFLGQVGAGGAIYNAGRLELARTTLSSNEAHSGKSPFLQTFTVRGPPGMGGGVANEGLLLATNCTYHGNLARGGDAKSTIYGFELFGRPSLGGALAAIGGTAILDHVTFSHNTAVRGQRIPPSVHWEEPDGGGAIYAANGTVQLFNSIVGNSTEGINCHGPVIDGGYNISSDDSCAFSHAGSFNELNPRLGTFGDHGGATFTVALLPGSPAINAADVLSCPSTDQRGRPRPQFGRCDMGAYEVQTGDLPPFLVVGLAAGDSFGIQIYGLPDTTYRLLRSSFLTHWDTVAETTTDSSGLGWFAVNVEMETYFFRAVADWP